MFLGADEIFADPFRIRPFRRKLPLDIKILQQYAARSVDSDHLAGAQSPLLHDRRIVHIHRSDFGADDDQSVVRNFIPAWTKSVAVKRCSNCYSVAEDQRSGSIPWLAEAFVVLEKCADGRVDSV